MTNDPAEVLTLSSSSPLASAGEFAGRVAKAAQYGRLDDATVDVLTVAAIVAERYASGYMPQDAALGALNATLGKFVAAMRERARADRAAAAA